MVSTYDDNYNSMTFLHFTISYIASYMCSHKDEGLSIYLKLDLVLYNLLYNIVIIRFHQYVVDVNGKGK